MAGMASETHVHAHHHAGHSSSHVDNAPYGATAHTKGYLPSDAALPIDDGDEEESDGSLLQNVKIQLEDIWNTVQLKAVWRPMAFVYVFNVLQVPNVAWQSYLQLTLHFEPFILVKYM